MVKEMKKRASKSIGKEEEKKRSGAPLDIAHTADVSAIDGDPRLKASAWK